MTVATVPQTTVADASHSAVLARLLHDEVLSEIRLSLLRLELLGSEATRTRDELLDLEHRLRTRCVEQRSLDGAVEASEVVDLHLRRVRSRGVGVRSTIRNDRRLSPVEVRRVDRAFSVTVGNALQAGASHIELSLDAGNDRLGVVVTDDAGGFDLEAAPVGGGLWNLGQECGTDAVRRRATGTGSTVTVSLLADSAREGLR